MFSTGFETIDVTLLDINHPATLTVDCGWSNAIYIDRGAFTHMKYIERFKVYNEAVIPCFITNPMSLALIKWGLMHVRKVSSQFVQSLFPGNVVRVNSNTCFLKH